MFQAITAAVGAISGLGTEAVKANAANYGRLRSEYEQQIAFSQAKDNSFYSSNTMINKMIMVTAIVGFLFIGFILYLTLKNK